MELILPAEIQVGLWRHVVGAVVSYASEVGGRKVGSTFSPREVREYFAQVNFDKSWEPQQAIEFALQILSKFQIQTTHPRYFGLFDPPPSTMGIIGETLVAAFNPQLAVWSHSPGPVEVERLLIREFAEKFGYDGDQSDGTFTSGGAEANHTALLTALASVFPSFVRSGMRALAGQPVLYISAEGHHSIMKAAQSCGLGVESVRLIEVDEHLKMNPSALKQQILRDRQEGLLPFLIVATLGTTNAGAIDPIKELADIVAEEKMWLHADAAWGGAVALVPELRGLLGGIERADSITFDTHKWLSIPRGAGLYLTRHPKVLGDAFKVDAPYMPVANGDGTEVVDPFRHSMQWTRHFIGLKVFLTLVVAGWQGYAEVIRQHLLVADYLRRKLEEAGWEVINDTSLAVICFFDRTSDEGSAALFLEAVRAQVIASGQAWVSIVHLANGRCAIRACVVNHRTSEADVDVLIRALTVARECVRRFSLDAMKRYPGLNAESEEKKEKEKEPIWLK